ncbi:MAG: serpin family protein [Clostridia bacterium]|nr:serpin family protein [Clostridia bacterium]
MDLHERSDATSRSQALPEPAAVAAANEFSLRLLRTLPGGEGRLVSPLSLLLALGMTAGGAAGETLAQFENLFGMTEEQLLPTLTAVRTALPEGLRAANGIWFREDLRFQPHGDFLQKNAARVGAALEAAAFDEETLRRINEFVCRHTDGQIPVLLDRLPKETVMVLVNALAFAGLWETPYEAAQLREGVFHAADGPQTVPFLHSREKGYLEHPLATGVVKPYAGGRLAFAALLPKEDAGVEALLQALDGEGLRQLLTRAESCEVDTAIPRFETESGFELSRALQELGLTDAFDPHRADFSRMGHCPDGAAIAIGSVVHKTRLRLDERGTEAAAATAVTMVRMTALRPTEPKTVRLDRPFVYAVVDLWTGMPLFLGVLAQVAGTGASV